MRPTEDTRRDFGDLSWEHSYTHHARSMRSCLEAVGGGYARHRVHPRLAPFVECVWTQQVSRRAGPAHPVLPDGCIDLLFNSPKTFARICRLGRLVAGLDAGASLVEAATRSGYCDQPHMARDFKAMMGITPTAYLVRG